MIMNKEMIDLLNDLRDFAANRVPINIESLKNTIKQCGYSVVAPKGKIGVFDDLVAFPDLYPYFPICVIHYVYIDENDIQVTSVTNSIIDGMDFVLY